MPRPGITAYDVLISCPGDVSDYLEVINQSIDNFNRMFGELNNITLVIKHWSKDSYPQSGDKPQELLNKQFVNDCDAAIAIFWTRFGTPTDKYGSGTEEEIEIMLNSDKQVFMYFLDLPINPSEIDMEQYQKVLDFRNKYKEKGLYAVIKDKHELQRELSNHLAMHFIPIISGESVAVNNKEKPELNIRNTEDYSEAFYTVHKTSLLESKFMVEQKEKIFNDIVELKKTSLPLNDKVKDNDIDTEESLKKVESSGIDSKHTELLQSITKGSFYTDVTISEDIKKVIKDFIKANQLIIEDDFWNLGNLKKSTLQLKLAAPFGTGGPTYEGSEAEKERFKQIKKLYWDIRTYNEYVIYFGEIDKINFLKLAISNNGTTFDEDIDIKFIIPKKHLINYSDLPMPGINIIKELIDIKFIDYIFSIEETETMDEYSGHPNYPLNIPSHLKNPLLLNQRSIEQEYEDYKDEFLSEFEYLFCYRTFENKNNDVVLFHVDYLKHNTTMAFPSVLMFKEIPPYIKYEISSKFSTEIIEGELSLNQN